MDEKVMARFMQTADRDRVDKINTLSTKMDETITKMFEKSANDIYEWIQILLNRTNSDVMPKFLAKFPYIKENVGLIHPVYHRFTETQHSTINNLAEKFREIVPAIVKMANQQFNLPSPQSGSSEEAEYHAGKLLAKLIKDEANGSSDDYDRLVFESNSPELFNALKMKVDAQVSAPAILVVEKLPGKTFYIAVDDVPLKVHGTFADALQAYMEVTWLFNLEYDDKVKSYANFFEFMMGFAKTSSTKRMQLYQKLLKLKDSENMASYSGSSSFMNAFH